MFLDKLVSAGGTPLVASSRSRGLLSFRAFSSPLDIGKDPAPVLQIGGILYDVIISKPSNHALGNMSGRDLCHAIRRVASEKETIEKDTHFKLAVR